MKSSLSVLPLQLWMKEYSEDHDTDDRVRIDAVFCRDGWYWDRKARREWYEHNGLAYFLSNDGVMFRYNVELANAHVLSAREEAACKEIIKLGFLQKNILKKLKSILYLDHQVKDLRKIRLGYARPIVSSREVI